MLIRKLNNQKYINASGIWVRDFTKLSNNYYDINNLIKKEDYSLILENEINNNKLQELDLKRYRFRKIIIISDGFNLKSNIEKLKDIPGDVAIIGVNGILQNWDATVKSINFYLINNPYKEALSFLPRKSKYYPSCLLSNRAYKEFASNYHGMCFKYCPPPQRNFGSLRTGQNFYIDDYRNPICASIVLSYYFGVEKLLLFCCDEMYNEQKDGTIKVGEHYMFPQQQLAHEIIDANLYWLKNKEENPVKTAYFGDTDYVNAQYIESVKEYFNNE